LRFAVRTYLLLLLIGVIVLGLASRMLVDDYRHRQNVVVARQLAATQGELLRLLELLSIERGAYNATLREDRLTDPAGDFLSGPARNLDATFAAALNHGEAAGHPAIDLPLIRRIHAAVRDWRRRADAAVILPMAARPAELMDGYVPAMIGQAAALTPALNALDAAIGRADSAVAGPMALARLAADMRSEASIRATTYVNIVASGQPIPPAIQLALAEYTGRVDALWSRIVTMLGIIHPSPGLAAKAEEAGQAFYTDLAGIYATIHAASAAGAAYPFTIAEFRARQSPLTYTAGYLRDAAIVEALTLADAEIVARGRQFAIVAAITAAAILLLVTGAVLFLRRVAGPLGAITGSLTRVARGEPADIQFTERQDDIGDVARALVLFQRHIEERGRRETEREMHKFMETMIDAMPVAITVKDRDLRYLFVNRYRRDVIGDEGKIVGRTLGEISRSEMAARVEEIDRTILTTGMPQHMEQVWPGRDGQPLVIWSLKVPFRDATGAIQGIVTCGVDITRLKEAEAELIAQRETAESANRSKTAFLASMSHELRTPLNAIIGFAEMLTAGFLGQLSNRQQDYLVNIQQSGEHLLHVVDDLLDLSRLETGHLSLQIADCHVDHAAVAALGMVRPLAQKAEVTIAFEPSNLVMPADERALTQIIVNLLSNAVKFNRPGGRASLRMDRWEGQLRITVSDTGIGMSDEDREAALRKLGPDNAYHARRGGGAGLGLSICRRLIDLHGGTLAIHSQRGQGTTVEILLPG
jgi:PAS domain S-box-containing protein